MDRNLIVIDNFLDDPDRIRFHALSLDFDRIQKSVPGVRSHRLGGDLQKEVETKLKTALGGEIVWDWTQDSFCFQSCQEGTETWVHVDSQGESQGEWAAVLYLTPNPILDSGTGIYESPDADMNIGVGNVYNRLVAYRGKVLYHRSILPGFGNTLETSRLTQTFFFDVK
ncbi:hypothetical protein CYVG_00132 [Cyanophage S-SSM6a]|jgi:hypothetical protein|uniref:Uncharacterized protein n=1 Tax=Synechococcus phage S-SSM7 TaxID=445686 RepID=E3SLI1_9CAUD|nr:minor coat protein [Synechococcus phage S-SSM7]ADO98329.1 hypothetical protein SSSM7_264 [Synechococcus phage S-SSM7]AGH07576.1 hypothetical protein CYVG_00132 [Cyanophage S-SSM6a]|tara:strand:- start:268 stop:774 length:507 start_codon:yes stop_codon:yes gene_type:complete